MNDRYFVFQSNVSIRKSFTKKNYTYWRIISHVFFVTWYVYSIYLHQSGKPNHCELGDKGFITGIGASMMWGDVEVQAGVGEAVSQKPSTAGHPGGWGRERSWRALGSCASV